MVFVWVEKMEASWFGLACHHNEIVATSVGASRGQALSYLMKSIPPAAPRRTEANLSEFAGSVIRMLAEIELGDKEERCFTLSEEYLSEGLRRVLYVASGIPRGYVASYGGIAKAAGSNARVVGRIMATNPLYPLVPCHRVVGADLALVGYGGRQDEQALLAKLRRLCRETLGFEQETAVSTMAGSLSVYPAEWAVRKAAELRDDSGRQLSLFS